MKFVLCILISAMSCVVPAVARLGETPEECEKRYGEGKETAVRLGEELKERGAGWTAATYLTRGLEVQVVFDGGKAVIVTYGNQPMFRLGEGGGSTVNLTADEIDRLKEVNVDGAQWRPYTTATMRKVAPGMKFWRAGDGEAYAGYNRETRRLFVCGGAVWELLMEKLVERHEGEAGSRLEGL